jgi:predicted DNA-binding transcriptional regulator AlpA
MQTKSNIIELNGKTYMLTEIKEIKKEERVSKKSFYLVSYELLPDFTISHHFPIKKFNIKDGRYRLPNGSVVSITTEQLVKPTKIGSDYEVSILSGMVKYVIDNNIHRCINQPKKKVVGNLQQDKDSRPYYNKAILKTRPDYKTAVRLLNDGLSMNEVARKTGLSYTTVYKINYSFCGYEPKQPYVKGKRTETTNKKHNVRGRSYSNEWIAERYNPNLTIAENVKNIGISKNTICRYLKESGIKSKDVKCVRRRVTIYERIDMKK